MIKLCCFGRLVVILTLILLAACSPPGFEETPAPPDESPTIQVEDLDIATGQIIYVPAYSEIYYAADRTLGLAITLSVHNTDLNHPIVLTSVRYYDAQGQLVKEFLSQPQQLQPLVATDFFIEQHDTSGGVGANFIVEWVAEQAVYEPVVEAVMIGTISSQGISFVSPGRVITQTGSGLAR
jgi:hypothetical protein